MNRVSIAALHSLAIVAVLGAAPVWAGHLQLHGEPYAPAPDQFAADFEPPDDSEWGFPIGGAGGLARGAERSHVPIVFVHGNGSDHRDWDAVREQFRAAGWTDQELWALSYNGMSNASAAGSGHPVVNTSNDVNVPDLAAFIARVRDYTGAAQVSLVSHSLGVTVARKTMRDHPELAVSVLAFVGIAGGNHGTSLCPPGSENTVNSCDELTQGSAWLEQLNGPDGALETYGATCWMTVYDGSGVGDVAYLGPGYAQSPRLRGADNREYPNTDHLSLATRADIVADYRSFIERCEQARAPAGTATGGGALGLWAALALLCGARRRLRCAEKIRLAELDAAVAQDRVGGGRMEKHIG
jgi:triacylglycerol lipase